MTPAPGDGTPKDTNGEGRWRLQTVERLASATDSKVNLLAMDFAVHKQQTADHIQRTEKRWEAEDQLRRDRQAEDDQWRAAQEKKLDFVRKVAISALVAFLTTSAAAVANALILLASR